MELRFDKSIYDKEVLLKTAYKFTDRVYFHLSQNDDEWIVQWKPKDDSILSCNEFENEMIHQQLRLHLINESKELRSILLGRAMASTLIEKPQEPTEQENECISSSESILRGWFDDN